MLWIFSSSDIVSADAATRVTAATGVTAGEAVGTDTGLLRPLLQEQEWVRRLHGG